MCIFYGMYSLFPWEPLLPTHGRVTVISNEPNFLSPLCQQPEYKISLKGSFWSTSNAPQYVKSWQTMCQVLTNYVSSPDKQCVKSWQTMCQVLTNNVSSPDKQCVKSWQTMCQVLINNVSSPHKQCVKSWQTMCQVLTNNVSSPDKQCVKSS